MRTVSTGAGLCVLGACVLGAAALSSPRLGGAASAAGVNKTAIDAAPPTIIAPQQMSSLAMPPGKDQAARLAVSVSSSAIGNTCQNLEPEIWFTAVHPLESCTNSDGNFRYPGSSFGSLDINNDGILEHTNFPYNPSLTMDSSSDTPIVLKDEVVFDGTTTLVGYRAVGVFAPIKTFLQNHPNPPSGQNSIHIYSFGWRDMDSDGDLDALFSMYWTTDPFRSEFAQVWLENTEYQAAPPRSPYDHDGDGSVNTADLSLLLLNFD